MEESPSQNADVNGERGLILDIGQGQYVSVPADLIEGGLEEYNLEIGLIEEQLQHVQDSAIEHEAQDSVGQDGDTEHAEGGQEDASVDPTESDDDSMDTTILRIENFITKVAVGESHRKNVNVRGKHGRYVPCTEESPISSTNASRMNSRRRAVLKRRKDRIVDLMKSLYDATQYTGFFVFRSPSGKSLTYGRTDDEFVESFKEATPFVPKEVAEKATLANKTGVGGILSRIKPPKEGVASSSPLPSPSKLPACLNDLAAGQRAALKSVEVNCNSSNAFAPNVLKNKKRKRIKLS